jgi:hypothetical protein
VVVEAGGYWLLFPRPVLTPGPHQTRSQVLTANVVTRATHTFTCPLIDFGFVDCRAGKSHTGRKKKTFYFLLLKDS